jgi:hypothetical protein
LVGVGDQSADQDVNISQILCAIFTLSWGVVEVCDMGDYIVMAVARPAPCPFLARKGHGGF